MVILFYIAAAVAIAATVLALTRANAVHALLYLVVSLLAVALMFFLLGAPLVAAFEVIIYAGAIVVLFLFTVMLLGITRDELIRERSWIAPPVWVLPGLLVLVLGGVLLYAVIRETPPGASLFAVGDPGAVGRALFGPYLLGVELASLLLLAGLVGAFHIGRGLQHRRRQEGGR